MTTKKIIIISLLAISLILAIFLPNAIFGDDDVGFIPRFLVWSTTLLFWVGISKGYTFAMDNGFLGGVAIVCALVGMYLSLPIALFQLFISNE